MILKMVTGLGSEVQLTPPDVVQSFHVQYLPHPHHTIGRSQQWSWPRCRCILFPIQSLITRLNYQRLRVTQYRLNSKVIFPLVIKGRTIRKVMGGWGKSQKKIHARENAKKKNSCKEEGKEKKFMQKEGPIMIFI